MWLKIVLFIIIVGIVGFILMGNFFYNYAVGRSKKSYIKVFSDLNNADPAKAEKATVHKWIENLTKSGQLEEMTMTAFDGVSLYGQVVHQPVAAHKWALCVHGYACNGRSMYKFAKRFYEKGFQCVLPDCRGHGKSGGKYMGMGWHDRLDLLQWIDQILTRDPQAEILLFGVSMGAAAVMLTAAERLPENVKCAVEDCGYTSAKDIFKALYQKEFPIFSRTNFLLPFDRLYRMLNVVVRRRAKYDMEKAAPIRRIASAQVPMMFIHGTKDNLVPYTQVYRLYEAAQCDKEIMLVEGAGHIKAYDVAKDSYWNKLFAFVDEHV